MANTSAVWPLYTAIAEALNADDDVSVLLGGDRVYNLKAPPGAAFDYIVLGSMSENEMALFGAGGSTAVATVHLWCQGHDAKRCAILYGEVHRVLNRSSLALTGYLARSIGDLQLIDIQPDPQADFVHGVARYTCMAVRA